MIFHFLPLLLLSSTGLTVRSWTRQLQIDSSECGKTKFCLMRPRGCHPTRDCTQGYMLSVVGPNQLKVEMFAQSLVPSVPLQYLAVGFSKDKIMGNDMVSECIVSETGIDGGGEVFLSYNNGKSNDRVQLDELESEVIYSNIHSSVINGRITCSFVQSLFPQLDSTHGARVLDLDSEFFIFGATGSAQPDEVNPHDLNRDSYYFPLISETSIIPSELANNTFDHPDSTLSKITTRKHSIATTTFTSRPVAASSFILSLITLCLPLIYFLF